MDKETLHVIEKIVNDAVARVMADAHKLHQEDIKAFSEQWRWDSWDSFKMRQKCKLKD